MGRDLGFLLASLIDSAALVPYPMPPAPALAIRLCASAAIGIAIVWRDEIAHSGEGSGAAEVLAIGILLYTTAAAIAGVLVRLAVLVLRAWGVGWRYAWLPAPVVLSLLIGFPMMLYWWR